MSLNRVIVTTGGTGGHIFPALAVAKELKWRNPAIQILFMGGSGPEGKLAREHGLEFQELPAKGIIGRGISGLLGGVGWIATALPKAMVAVRRFKPDAVIGFGGYAGFCPVLAAALMGIPTAIHEQNSVPGVTNKVLSKVVKRIFLSFPDELGIFSKCKSILVGNPVRDDILKVAGDRIGREPGKRILVLGGSQGARPINDAIITGLPRFMEAGVTLVHQAGKADYDRVFASYQTAGADPKQVQGFIDDMRAEYTKADLVICRSGASTIFEISASGLPSILVPFPQATHDHQTMNAKALSDIDAAVLLSQTELTGEVLADRAIEMLDDVEKLDVMGKAARGFDRFHAATDIATGLEALAG